MGRITLLIAVVLGLAACGGSDGPAVTQVSVTVRQGGAVLPNAPVVMSAGIDDTRRPPVPTGQIGATQNTNASGQTVFTVPGSTTTGMVCFSSSLPLAGGSSFADECASLNALSPTVVLGHL